MARRRRTNKQSLFLIQKYFTGRTQICGSVELEFIHKFMTMLPVEFNREPVFLTADGVLYIPALKG